MQKRDRSKESGMVHLPMPKSLKTVGEEDLEDVIKKASEIQTQIPDLNKMIQDNLILIHKTAISYNPLQAERFIGDQIYIQPSPALNGLLGKEENLEIMKSQKNIFIV